MEPFKSLFGISQDTVRKNCVLMPFLPPEALKVFDIKDLSRGAVFSAASNEETTVIKTGIGAGFVGDAVLYLQATPCTNIFFLGSCGLINQTLALAIGDLILPRSALGFESISAIINNCLPESQAAFPDNDLYARFQATLSPAPHTGHCVSFASLHEEEKHLALFNQLDADIIEMECAALFLAARKTGKKALALLYISDILGKTRFFEQLSPDNKKRLSAGAKQAALHIKTFIEQDHR
ncbi:MAG: hypothetical protein HQL20_02885 [Candidatus Omnitrophica bacterium]|nr:hypothetical protein [Candidatus Omnitrophota bacterium]